MGARGDTDTGTPAPPGLRELLDTWHRWSDADMWRVQVAKAEAAGDPERLAVVRQIAESEDAGAPGALDALRASTELVRLLTGWRWIAVRAAREEGRTWEQIGASMSMSKQGARDLYVTALERQEMYASDYSDTAAARAVAGPDPVPGLCGVCESPVGPDDDMHTVLCTETGATEHDDCHRHTHDEAEFYAAGGRRLTVHHGATDLPREVRDAIDDAADRAGYIGGGLVGTSGPAHARRTTWSWSGRCSRRPGVEPAAIVAAAAEVARRCDPGTWRIDDDAR